jgi:hypothetical protein
VVRWDPYIPAGSKGEIVIQLKPKRLDGKFERIFKVVSNDPQNPEVPIRFYGYAPKFLFSTSGDHF